MTDSIDVKLYCSVYELPDGSRFYGDDVYASSLECDESDMDSIDVAGKTWTRLGHVELTGVDRNRSDLIQNDLK